jgi:hypothetical protein
MRTFFTQSRQGAKGNKPIRLGAFASLREISSFKSKRRDVVGHPVGNAFDAMLDQVVAEIDEETESFIHQPQISEYLLAVDCVKRRDRFHFHDYTIIDDQVRPKPFIEPDPIPCDWNRDLSFHQIAMFAQFMCEGNFVHDLEDTWPEPSVEPVGSVDDQCCDFIFFHVGKPAPRLPSREAKKNSDSLPGTRTFLTRRRKDAKKNDKSKRLSAFASLRAISGPESHAVGHNAIEALRA